MQKPRPMPVGLTEKKIEHFWSCADVRSKDECWEWLLAILPSGYGVTTLDRKQHRAHRIAYYLHYGIDPGEAMVCHRCDNRCCINPHHLFLGNPFDNMADMKQKGRALAGERSPCSKVTNDDAVQIRRLYSTGDLSLCEIGQRFGITTSSVHRITKNITHKSPDCVETNAYQVGRYGKRLTWNDVREIRRQFREENIQQSKLARMYGVNGTAIHNIVHFKTWKEA